MTFCLDTTIIIKPEKGVEDITNMVSYYFTGMVEMVKI